MYHILFIHSSVSGYLDCFQVLAIENSAAKDIGMHVSFQTMFLKNAILTWAISLFLPSTLSLSYYTWALLDKYGKLNIYKAENLAALKPDEENFPEW